MAAAVVPPVEAHGVDAVQALHAGRELRLMRLDEQMEVVVEQHPGVEAPPEAVADVFQQRVPGGAVVVVEDDRPPLDAAADDVVPGRARQRGAR